MCDTGGMGSGDGFFGGAGGPAYNTPMNTVGVGDPVPAGKNTLGNDWNPWGYAPTARRKKVKNVQPMAQKRQAM